MAVPDELTDWCRHCGGVDILTQEHIPPRSAGNSGWTKRANNLPIGYEPHRVLDRFDEWADGHTVPTLCDDCNFKPSSWGYVASYANLTGVVESEARKRAILSGGFDPIANDQFGELKLPYDHNPRRFLAQCVGMIMAAQMERTLTDEADLRQLIGADLKRADRPPGPASLRRFTAWLALCNQPTQFGRRPSLAMNHATGRMSKHWIFLFTPFAFVLADDAGGPAWDAVDITHWAEKDHHERLTKTERHVQRMPCLRGKRGIF